MANGQLRGLSPFLVSAFSFQHFSFCQSVALGGFARIPAFHFLLSAFAWRWPGPAFARWMLDVRCWMFGVYHKLTKYNPPLPPPPGRSGGTLVPPWTYPGTIDHLPDPLFDQALLSKSVFSGVSALCRRSGLDVEGWMLAVGCSMLKLASAVRHHRNTCDFHASTAFRPSAASMD